MYDAASRITAIADEANKQQGQVNEQQRTTGSGLPFVHGRSRSGLQTDVRRRQQDHRHHRRSEPRFLDQLRL
jgi:hypothetical protein